MNRVYTFHDLSPSDQAKVLNRMEHLARLQRKFDELLQAIDKTEKQRADPAKVLRNLGAARRKLSEINAALELDDTRCPCCAGSGKVRIGYIPVVCFQCGGNRPGDTAKGVTGLHDLQKAILVAIHYVATVTKGRRQRGFTTREGLVRATSKPVRMRLREMGVSVTNPAYTSSLNRLEKRGLVLRLQRDGCSYKNEIILTLQGLEVARRISAHG